MISIFKKFSKTKIMDTKFKRIPYQESMLKYGTDKPDLRNPLLIYDISNILNNGGLLYLTTPNLLYKNFCVFDWPLFNLPTWSFDVVETLLGDDEM